MFKEEWRMIPGYEGLYMVSSLGRVKSLPRNTTKGRILVQHQKYNGYLEVVLSKEGRHKTWFVHRLVAISFIPNPHNLPCVNHKNEDKTDNCVENLEWCDYQYNNGYGTKRERLSIKMTNGHSSKKVGKYSIDGVLLCVYPSTSQAKRETGIPTSNISDSCYGKRKTAGGFKWKYLN